MLEEVRPELVSIATESGSHAEIALRCIGSSIHTIIEKPMAMSLQDADRIIAAAEQSGVTVSVCQQCRFNRAVQAVRHALEEGRFGTLRHGSINVYWNRNRDYYSHDSWLGTWKDDGGCLLNQCIHGADLLRWMMGPEITRVYGATRNHLHPYLETEDVGTAVVEFKNGTVGVLEGSSNVFRGNLEETLYLFGSGGRVKLGGPSANNVEVWDFAEEQDGDSEIRNLTEPALNVYGHGHARLFADVAEAIRDRRRPYVDVYAGRDALELILAVYMSQKTGQPVDLPLKDFGTMDMTGIFGRKSL
jgi:predicted dehydrogenase